MINLLFSNDIEVTNIRMFITLVTVRVGTAVVLFGGAVVLPILMGR